MVSHIDPASRTRAWAETAASFYRRERPDAHFRTSSSTSPAFADAIAGLLAEHPDLDAVVEVGAGVGTLLAHLHRRRLGLRLTGIDLRDRPRELDPAVGWAVDQWVGRDDPRVRGGGAGWRRGTADAVFAGLSGPTLVLACEFLDDLPPTTGDHDDGRADAWAWLVQGLRRTGGLALLVDYVTGANREQQLLGYRDGQAVPPRIAADHNTTAPVDLDAVTSAGEAVGATTLARLRQSEAVRRWSPVAPGACSGTGDPNDQLAELVQRSERYALTAPDWLGGHWWLVQRITAAGSDGHVLR
ncbi:MAG: hypothetical protein ACR2LI_14435 [Propionibacteriaceae bacterium]